MIEMYALTAKQMILIHKKKTKKNKLCFAILLKYFECEGCCPISINKIDPELINCIAKQLEVDTLHLDSFNWKSRTVERFKKEVRGYFSFRAAKKEDFINLKSWLKLEVFPQALRSFTHLEHSYSYFRKKRIEPTSVNKLSKYVKSAYREFEQDLFLCVYQKLSSQCLLNIDNLISADDVDDEQTGIKFKDLKKHVPGAKLKNVEFELGKLNCLRNIGLPYKFLEKTPHKLLKKYYSRVLAKRPSHIQEHAPIVRYGMFSIFCFFRLKVLTDDLIDMLLKLIHGMNTSANNFVKKSILADIVKVSGKFNILFSLANIAINNPDGIISDKIYSQISQETLQDLVKELGCQGKWYQNQVQTKIYSLYNHAHRKVILPLLETFTFRTELTASKPLLEALEFIKKNKKCIYKHYKTTQPAPISNVISRAWINVVVENQDGDERKINRIYYELAVLQELHRQIQCKMIWVEGAFRYQDPGKNLPQDFEQKREYYYGILGLPLDYNDFLNPRRKLLEETLDLLNSSIKVNNKVKVNEFTGNIKLSPSKAQEEPLNINVLNKQLKDKWSTVNLIDILKEADLEIGFTKNFHTAASRKNLSEKDLQHRLLLNLYAIGTNAGIKCISSANNKVTYSELLYVKRQFINAESVRAATAKVVNKTLSIRDSRYWGEATTTVACDSKKISVWDQNLMAEWHTRYKGRGVMVYWHVDTNALCVYSQLKTCSSSEVGAVVKGILNHNTEMLINRATMDTHGQSLVGFAVGEFLQFDLLPRLKNISKQKLYYPNAKHKDKYKNIAAILKSPIIWKLIEDNYDDTIKYMVALKLGYIDPDMFIKQFSHDNFQHPVYQTLVELGKVAKTIFLCNYLSDEKLRIEIHEYQNIVERLNSIMNFIFYGRLGEINSNKKDDQELSIACLHLLQACMGYVNTLLLQDILSKPEWDNKLTSSDKRALNVLVHSHINPYGLFPLDLDSRLGI